MQIVWYAVVFTGLVWSVTISKSRRKLVAVTLAGAMVLTLVGAPQPAHSQAPTGILSAIQAVLSVINGLIQTALTSINTARTALNNLQQVVDRKSTRLNSSHLVISYAVFCLKKKNT